MTLTDHFNVLGIPHNATDAQVNKAYREKVKEHHPDRGGSSQQFHRVQQAREELQTSQQRQDLADAPQRPTKPNASQHAGSRAQRHNGQYQASRQPSHDSTRGAWWSLAVYVTISCVYYLGWLGHSTDAMARRMRFQPLIEHTGGWHVTLGVAVALVVASGCLLVLQARRTVRIAVISRPVLVVTILWATPLVIAGLLLLTAIAIVMTIGSLLLRSLI